MVAADAGLSARSGVQQRCKHPFTPTLPMLRMMSEAVGAGTEERKPGLGCCALCWCRLAQEIEPGYCEPTYWLGLTAMNMGNTSVGLSVLKASLSCRYSAVRVWVLWSAAVQQAQAKWQQAGVAWVAELVQKGFGMSFLRTALSVVDVCAVSRLQVHRC